MMRAEKTVLKTMSRGGAQASQRETKGRVKWSKMSPTWGATCHQRPGSMKGFRLLTRRPQVHPLSKLPNNIKWLAQKADPFSFAQ